MAKFRKKPVVIDAEQYLDGKPVAGMVKDAYRPDQFYVSTLEGLLHVSPGDWIITGVKGERYPCKPDIFAATYEPAE